MAERWGLEDWDEPDVDLEQDDGPDTFICPSCREVVAEEAQKCPHCGDWITPTEPSGRKRAWFVWAVVLMIALMLLMTFL